MQTILGSGGAIGVELAKALRNFTNEIRLVSRNPEKVNPTDELMPADLLKSADVQKAVHGSEVVYLTVGLPYSLKVWEENWPILMENVVNACIKNNSKLVFFDNIYMYDASCLNRMTEETPINPPSKKGKVRNKVVEMILEKTREGKLTALIARSADFYGPNVKATSMLTEMVFKPLSTGKKANWMGNVNCKHSFTYTPDAGKATALLGNTEDAYNQVWHLPTASDPFTGKEWIVAISKEMGVKPDYRVASKFIVKIMGWFMPIMQEMIEMLYQYEQDYVFDSSKFEQRFDFESTPYLTGIKKIVESDYK